MAGRSECRLAEEGRRDGAVSNCSSLAVRRLPGDRGYVDVSDEAKALSRNGADDGLILAAVANRSARGVDAARQGRFGDDAAVPDSLDEIVLADDAVAIFDQVDQQVEHLRLDADILAGPGQLAQPRIQHMVGKMKLHMFAP